MKSSFTFCLFPTFRTRNKEGKEKGRDEDAKTDDKKGKVEISRVLEILNDMLVSMPFVPDLSGQYYSELSFQVVKREPIFIFYEIEFLLKR